MFGEKEKQKVYIGSDHAGFKAKEELRSYISEKGFDVVDLGCFNEDSCDYPVIAREVSEKVLETEGSRGVLICGTGIGMSMAANKLKGIRAALAVDENMAQMSRQHNDANVVAMGARITEVPMMKKIVDKFLTTPFSGEERHMRRVSEIEGE